jgi:O-antigen ligase
VTSTQPNSPLDVEALPGLQRLLALLLVGGLLAILALRTTTSFDPFPAWASDPLLVASPVVAVTPALALALDVLTLLISGALLVLLARRAIAPTLVELGLFLSGTVAIILHALVFSSRTLDDVIIGSSWLSAIGAGLAISVAARVPHLRALIAGTIAALAAAFALRAGVQVFVDHPQTVRMFRETRATFFASQGWTEGSSMALAYERRLMQAEGSAWFGLANVLATTGATTLTLALGLITSRMTPGWPLGWPGGPRRSFSSSRPPLALIILALLSLATVILAGSKGGYAAALLGVTLIALSHIAPRLVTSARARLAAGLLGPLLIALVLIAVAVRGLLGERFGELSLLFRAFYFEGAIRIFIEHPLLGVGPAGFKDAYMLVKPALAPEDVSSPHSVLFDYAACLGVLGLGWAALLILWSSHAGRSILSATRTVDVAPSTALTDVAADADVDAEAITQAAALRTPFLAILALSTGVASVIERPMATLEGTLVRVIALVLGIWIALAVARLVLARPKTTSAALAAAALVALVHSQIELTATHANSAMWLMVVVALVAACRGQNTASSHPHLARIAGFASGVSFLLIASAMSMPIPSTFRWQSSLIAAESGIAPIREATQLLDRASRETNPSATLEEVRSILQPMSAKPIASTPQAIAAAFDQIRTWRAGIAFADLTTASRSIARTPHFPTDQALMTLVMRQSTLNGTGVAPPYDNDPMGWSLAMAKEATKRSPKSASAWAWLAVVADAAKGRTAVEPGTISAAWVRASDLSPRDPEFARRATSALHADGQADAARDFAQRALTNHDNSRLDPLRQLSEREVEALRAILR